ncbi:2-C-methyl-D-erythritol 4-phosphate cytidylyltransferase [Puia dinghuensis]|uniref:2-C-methyl-D-erythritol 4-phosphate cytidylyltransferase n=1 Tax=Puia dinghuensis TaxID=1792502 RepID=A0A8J2UH65_9BACT|nr:2-C-methyl-D-erythritol 4-phosphate cytidylyltransferase [Puia dinghuensis]GGB15004.1 2-C-methyl-D-erythritol 4-phosphate cytidylyltransferase [Puia dinghuensis]
MKKYAVIVAGGSGSRMGKPVPKQFLLLQGKSVLWYSLNTFLSAYDDCAIVLVVPAAYWEAAQAIAGSTIAPERVVIVVGGETRFHSVRNGLKLVEGESVVAVHDGVRCLASVGLVRRCFEEAMRMGSAIPVVDCKDSVRWVEGEGSKPLDRDRIKLVQTPQTFLSSILMGAFERVGEGAGFTDEATVVEAAGHPVHLVEGEVNNIKITLPADLVFAERVVLEMNL